MEKESKKQELDAIKREMDFLKKILDQNPSVDGKKQLEELQEECAELARNK